MRQIKALAQNLMLLQYTLPTWALKASKFSAHALDLSHFTRKSKYALTAKGLGH